MLEWFFTLLFSVLYLLRLRSVKRPLKYALSFYGVVDLLSIARAAGQSAENQPFCAVGVFVDGGYRLGYVSR